MEFALGVIAACCPAIVPLFKRRQVRHSYHDIGSTPANDSDRMTAKCRSEGRISGPRGWLEAAVRLEFDTMTTQSTKDHCENDEEQQYHEQRLRNQKVDLLTTPKPAFKQHTSIRRDYSGDENG